MRQAGGEKRLIGGDTESDRPFEAVNELATRRVAAFALANQLGNHRIVERRNFRAGLQRVFGADFVRHLPQRHFAGLRHEIVTGILGAQPRLDRVSEEHDVVLR